MIRRVLAVLSLALAGMLLASASSLEAVEPVSVIEPIPPFPGDGGW